MLTFLLNGQVFGQTEERKPAGRHDVGFEHVQIIYQGAALLYFINK